MLEIDLLCHVGGGKRRKLQWNRQHPAAAHLTGLAGELDGRGVPATLRRVLRHLRGVEVAVHFGSRARGTHRGDSDVDVLVVGDVDAAEAHACALELEKQFDVAVDLHVMSREEYERQRAEPLSFVHGILAAPHLVLVA